MENLYQYLLDEATLWVPKIVAAVVILVAFYVLAKIVSQVIKKASSKLQLDEYVTLLFVRTSHITILTFGLITSLGTLGINVSALVAGLGLTGFALGFALKDTISNLISGVFILLHRPFRIGDSIKIAGFEGIVKCIDLRYTQLENEGDKILIPNSKIFTDPITVLSGKAVD